MIQKVSATNPAGRVPSRRREYTMATIAGVEMKLSNLTKVLYPETGFTKGQVIDYYRRIAPVILPHLKDRPVTLKRYPDGVEHEAFFEKSCPGYRPEWMATSPIDYQAGNPPVNHCILQNEASLAWVANLASIELHTSLAYHRDIETPTMLTFDLDPGPPAGMIDCMSLAVEIRELLGTLKLTTFVKTSGGKGIHLYIPLNTPTSYEKTKPFARAVAELFAQQQPEKVVAKMSKALRTGKVFIDWSQNSLHKTTVCVYSLRARNRPTVSTPITWEELEAALKKRDPERITFETADVLRRVEKRGDVFAEVLTMRQKLPTFESAAEGVTSPPPAKEARRSRAPRAKAETPKASRPRSRRRS